MYIVRDEEAQVRDYAVRVEVHTFRELQSRSSLLLLLLLLPLHGSSLPTLLAVSYFCLSCSDPPLPSPLPLHCLI